MKIEGSVALVTGTSRGLGRAWVDELLARGARRVYSASREGVVHADPRVVPLRLDVTDSASVAAAATAAPDLNLLINNAGSLHSRSVLHADPEQLQRDFDVNVLGMLAMSRALIPALAAAAPNAAIVNVLSLVAMASIPRLGGYSASKAAAWSLTQSLRAELRAKGIRVHAVYPGVVDTDMTRGIPGPKVQPELVARAGLDGLAADQEEIGTDPMSIEGLSTFAHDPRSLERHLNKMV